MIRLFLADDHTIVRNGIRAMLAGEPDLVVVGEAIHGQELLEQLATTPADVVLLDVHMPVLDGLATTLRLHAEFPDVRVLVLTMLAQVQHIGQMFDAGARGYVLKSAEQSEMVAAVRAVAAGRQFLCSELGLAMLQRVRTLGHAPKDPDQRAGHLTAREKEVLQLLADGLTTNQIAARLFTSTRTVETHRQNILEKTQTKNTAALIRLAVIEGLLS
ncbi:response regulator [Hymenobacter caeli]|uniref:DNA-binding NarL/FixJ family response regulator n=1 Tax=Hymenobacter caeli TaxID=2735894 RepID=A0ABX2FN18_9BACT|nr:response regulator transcription factor [Hymenobacter caeli]NRT18550.1 DNA-binding NarL/FixJ family response regulator [Hymenobacter caeli]